MEGIAIRAIEIDHARNPVGMVRGEKTQLLPRNRVADQHRPFDRERVEHLEHVSAQPFEAVARVGPAVP